MDRSQGGNYSPQPYFIKGEEISPFHGKGNTLFNVEHTERYKKNL